MATFVLSKDGIEVNTIVSDPAFVSDYCARKGYTYEEIVVPEPEPVESEPTTEEILNAMLGVE